VRLRICLLNAKKNKPPYNYLTHTKTVAEIEAFTNKTEKVFYMLCGEFSNKAQADTTKIPFMKTPQQILAVPIWQDTRKGEYWLYIGWFSLGNSKKALAQSILKIVPEKDAQDELHHKLVFYALPNEAENDYYSEEWKKPKPFSALKPKDLLHTEGCSGKISGNPDNKNEFFCTQPTPCPQEVSEQIKFYAFIGTFTPDRQVLYTEYYDKDKKLLFGYPRPAGLQLLRQDKNKPAYAPIQPTKN